MLAAARLDEEHFALLQLVAGGLAVRAKVIFTGESRRQTPEGKLPAGHQTKPRSTEDLTACT